MKKTIAYIVVISVSLLACKKKVEDLTPETTRTEGQAYVKIVQASPSFRAVFGNRDSFNVYTNLTKLTAPFLTYSSVFPASNNYVVVPVTPSTVPVQSGVTFRFSIQGTTTADSMNLYTFSKMLNPDQHYSLIITDSIKSSDETKQMWLKDDYTQPIPSQFGIRFVHAVMNDTVGKTVDLYSVKSKANLFSNVPIGSATGFSYFPTTITGDTLIVRRPGVTAWELARLIGQTYSNQRVYTYIYRGDTKTTGTKGKILSSYINL